MTKKTGIHEIEFDDIYPIWDKQLWENRVSRIETNSALAFWGGYDMRSMDTTPTFFGYYIDGELAGVNSGHKTFDDGQYRSRGLFVFPNHRNKGIGLELLQATMEQAKSEGCKKIWSLPRKDSLNVYLKAGFQQMTEFFDHGVEYGPNCFVRALL